MNESEKIYIGDGVYAENVGDMILLTTERDDEPNREGGTDRIYLDYETWLALKRYVARRWTA